MVERRHGRDLVTLRALAPVLLVAACGGGDASGAEELLGRATWQLAAGSVDGEEIVVPDGYRVTLLFSEGVPDDEYDVGGTAACNGYGARVEVLGTSVSFADDIARQEALCSPPSVMAAEDAYLAALPRVTDGEREGDSLVLTGDGVRLVFMM